MNPIILHADHLILMDPNNTIIPDGAVLVGADGRIKGVGESPAIINSNPGVGVNRLKDRLLWRG